MAVAAIRSLALQDWLTLLAERAGDSGPLGAAGFVLAYVAACVLLVPASLLTLAAGAAFGLLPGVALVSVGATAGATAAFLIGRHLARAWVRGRVERDPRFARIDRAVGREGWKIVLLTRLSPAFPFTLLNYAFGITAVGLREYVLASWLGMLPGTFLYVYLGSLARDLASAGAGQSSRSPAEWALLLVGLAATAAVTIFIARLARRSLADPA
ncbi:MAG: TVP38/TMEM64 family protein [Elusimicrobia bacterium]|nr:TVP38/TMEM64 family protein [Elusimicrobiota bacterium]